MDDIRAYLEGKDKKPLVEMLMERVNDDERLERHLLTKAAKKRAKGLGLSACRKAIDIAVDTGGFVDYHSAYGYADGVMEAINSIKCLIGSSGKAADQISPLNSF